MDLLESQMSMDTRTLIKHIEKLGWTFKKEGGSHSLYSHPKSNKYCSIPRHRGDLPPGTVKQILRTAELKEEVDVKKPDDEKKLVLGKNKSSVKLNPIKAEGYLQKLRDIAEIKRLPPDAGIIETKADSNMTYYPEKSAPSSDSKGPQTSDNDLNKAFNDPYGVLNDPNAPSTMKDLAFRVVNIRTEEEDEDSNLDLFEALKVGRSKEQSESDRKEAEKWHKEHPINHENIIHHYNMSTPEEKHAGTNWYHEAHHLNNYIADATKTPRHVMAGLIANYSPQTNWGTNMVTASEVARTKVARGGPGEGVMANAFQKHAAQKMLNGEHYDNVLKGEKVRDFAHLIEHGGNKDPNNKRAVIDRHAYSVAAGARMSDIGYNNAGLKSKKKYKQVANMYKIAADHISEKEGRPIEPHQLQAITWLTRQRLNQEEDQYIDKKIGSNAGGAGRTNMNHWDKYKEERFPHLTEKTPNVGYT